MSSGKVLTLCLCALALTSPARADVCLAAREVTNVERALVIESPLSPAPVTWLALETRGKTRVAWLIDEPEQRSFEPRGDALLETLDEQSTPRFIPLGIDASECGRSAVPARIARQEFAPIRLQRLEDSAALAAELAALGANSQDCALTPPVELIELEAPAGPGRSRAVRVFGGGPLAFSATFRSTTTFLSLAAGRVDGSSVPLRGAGQLGTTYWLARRDSDYPLLRDSVFAASTQTLGILEAVMPVFQLEAPRGERSPLIAAYFRASASDAAAHCSATLDDHVAAAGDCVVAPSCPSPSPLPADWPARSQCDASELPGTLAADALRCGDADDVALALAGLVPENSWLTRVTASVEPGHARALSIADASAVGPWYPPSRIESSGCRPTSASPALPSSGGGAVPLRPGDVGVTPLPDDEDESGGAVIVSEPQVTCSANTASSARSDDSCSGNSEPYDSESSESCSGDATTTSDDSDDDSCSGDSSAAEGDESCSGDSSDSSGAHDDSCSGSSQSSEDEGDSCSSRRSSSGSSELSRASAASGSAKRPAARGRRTRASIWTLALSSVWLPVRRGTRRRS